MVPAFTLSKGGTDETRQEEAPSQDETDGRQGALDEAGRAGRHRQHDGDERRVVARNQGTTQEDPEGVMKRGEPRLCRDYYGELFIVIDDDGEPVTEYYTDFDIAREQRDNYCDVGDNRPWAKFRIAQVSFKAVVPDDGSPVKIADDPLEVPDPEWERQTLIGESGGALGDDAIPADDPNAPYQHGLHYE